MRVAHFALSMWRTSKFTQPAGIGRGVWPQLRLRTWTGTRLIAPVAIFLAPPCSPWKPPSDALGAPAP
eukprot:8535160-Lingulodinium_polyedra.AAC.1